MNKNEKLSRGVALVREASLLDRSNIDDEKAIAAYTEGIECFLDCLKTLEKLPISKRNESFDNQIMGLKNAIKLYLDRAESIKNRSKQKIQSNSHSGSPMDRKKSDLARKSLNGVKNWLKSQADKSIDLLRNGITSDSIEDDPWLINDDLESDSELSDIELSEETPIYINTLREAKAAMRKAANLAKGISSSNPDLAEDVLSEVTKVQSSTEFQRKDKMVIKEINYGMKTISRINKGLQRNNLTAVERAQEKLREIITRLESKYANNPLAESFILEAESVLIETESKSEDLKTEKKKARQERKNQIQEQVNQMTKDIHDINKSVSDNLEEVQKQTEEELKKDHYPTGEDAHSQYIQKQKGN